MCEWRNSPATRTLLRRALSELPLALDVLQTLRLLGKHQPPDVRIQRAQRPQVHVRRVVAQHRVSHKRLAQVFAAGAQVLRIVCSAEDLASQLGQRRERARRHWRHRSSGVANRFPSSRDEYVT